MSTLVKGHAKAADCADVRNKHFADSRHLTRTSLSESVSHEDILKSESSVLHNYVADDG